MTKSLIEKELDKEKVVLGTGVIRDNSMIYYKNIQIILKTCRAEAEKGIDTFKKEYKHDISGFAMKSLKQILKDIYG